MKYEIEQWVLKAVQMMAASYPDQVWEGSIHLMWSKQGEHGHLSTNVCFQLAKIWRVSPMVLADALAASLQKALDDRVEAVIAVKGYINIALSAKALQGVIATVRDQGQSYGVLTPKSLRKIHLEYVSANPTGPLHVGHGRGAVLGSALAALLRTQGSVVEEVYYVNDCGRQIEILAMSVWVRYAQKWCPDLPLPAKAYQGDYIFDIAKAVEAWKGDVWCKPLHEKVVAESKQFGVRDDEGQEAQLDEVIALCRTWLGKDDFAELMVFVAEAVMTGLREDLDFFRVHQSEFKESALVHSGAVESGVKQLQDLGYIDEIEGQIWFRASELGDDKDRVMIRRDGRHTYFAADVAYHLTKFQGGYDQVIDVFGSDHHGYVPRLQALIKACDFDPSIFSVVLVQFATLYRGQEKVSMSTRSGEFVTLRALAEEVGVDAARFFYLMRKSAQHMDFDIELAKKESMDNPVYYVQYAHARICSVQTKHVATDVAPASLSVSECEGLCLLLLRYPEVLTQCAQQLVVHPLVQYVRDLAMAFHSYYGQVRLVGEKEDETQARMALVEAVRIVIENVLTLLGVSAPRSM